jgi:hypothetical protein
MARARVLLLTERRRNGRDSKNYHTEGGRSKSFDAISRPAAETILQPERIPRPKLPKQNLALRPFPRTLRCSSKASVSWPILRPSFRPRRLQCSGAAVAAHSSQRDRKKTSKGSGYGT